MDFTPLLISLKTAVTATFVTFFVGIAAAWFVAGYRGRLKGLIDGIFTLPMVLPPTVVGFFLLVIFGKHGPMGKLLDAFGTQIIFSWSATVIAATVVAFPLMYKTTRGAFEQIDENIINAARTLGVPEWKIFWRVTIPLAWPGVAAGTVLSFARALGEFGATLMVAGNIPGRTQTIPIAIFFDAEGGEMDKAMTWVIIIFVISLVVMTLMNYWTEYQKKIIPYLVQKKGAKKQSMDEASLAADSVFPFRNRKTSSTVSAARLSSGNELAGVPSSGTFPEVGGEVISDAFSAEELIVDMKKKLQGFTLRAKFDSGSDALGLLGASGSGKSMTLRCIAGLEKPNTGHIVLNGRVLFDSEKGINVPVHRRKIGFVFQNYALFPNMTVEENIGFALGKMVKSTKSDIVKQMIEMVRLEGLEQRYPFQLSGGQQQRVALARALAIEPEALLLDEPFSALDDHLRNLMAKLLADTLSSYHGVTLFVTHNMEEVYRICNRVVILMNGKIEAQGEKDAIFQHPPTLGAARLTGCKNYSHAEYLSEDTIKALDWGVNVKLDRPVSEEVKYVGIRANYIELAKNMDGENVFACWPVHTNESAFRMTVYVFIGKERGIAGEYHLQWEVSKDRWNEIKKLPLPWSICLRAEKLIPLLS